MAGDSGFDWRDLLRRLLPPGVLVAAAVLGVLVTLGVACLRDAELPADSELELPKGNTTFSGPLIVRGGIQAGNNITMTAGSLVNSNGAVTVTDDLLLMQPVVDGSGSVRIYDTLAITGNTTVTGDTALNGNVSTGTGSFRINDNALITGTLGVTGAVTADYHVSAAGNLTVTGNIAMSNGYLVSSKGGVTVTDELKVTSQATFDNGIVNTGNITNTGSLSVTAIASLYGLGLGLGSTQAITANYGITPGNASILYVTDDGGQASGTVTLDSTVSIVSGTRIGQLLLIMYVDTAGATMTIKDNGNVQLPSGSDLALGLYDSVLVMWDGTDWIAVNACDN